ncbi:MAG: cellulase family glycosylhydrolase, partial [Paracoccaceae bacterium]|nr:cellulase family glycosylhydrolase [Paracoccaceae bacterium]
MSGTSGINAIHILFFAEPQAALDQVNGSYAENLAQNANYYNWQGNQQLIPMGMDGDPEVFAAALHSALPGVNTLRLSFSAHSFDGIGALHPQYERFLVAATAQGFKLILTYHDGEAQQLGQDGTLSPDEIHATLSGTVKDRMLASWGQMMGWLDGHTAVRDAVYGYELVNEPAAYERGVVLTQSGFKADAEQRFVELYARHMAEVAALIEARDDANILVGGWGFSGRFQELADNSVGGQSALDYLRGQIGDNLIWSAHLYPGWLGTNGAT